MIDKSLNLARRLSARNEVDLLQEDMMTDEETKYTQKYCEEIAKKMPINSDIPLDCKHYESVMAIIRRKENVRSAHAVAFEGMTPGEAQAAMAARERGHLNPMQIQRRMTHRHHTRIW